MVGPRVHLNGTGGESLLEGYRAALDAVSEAIGKVSETAPHGRDYYVQGDTAYSAARAAHDERMAKLVTVRVELQELAMHVFDQVLARQRAKGRGRF